MKPSLHGVCPMRNCEDHLEGYTDALSHLMNKHHMSRPQAKHKLREERRKEITLLESDSAKKVKLERVDTSGYNWKATITQFGGEQIELFFKELNMDESEP